LKRRAVDFFGSTAPRHPGAVCRDKHAAAEIDDAHEQDE
jgi:hypothetical protein